MVFKLPKILSSYTDWLEKQQNSILSAAAVIMVANVVSSLMGFVQIRLIYSHFVDTSIASRNAYDAFLFAFSIPDMMFRLIIVGALSAAFIPIFTSYREENEEKAFAMTSSLMTLLLTIFLVIGAFVFLFARPIMMAIVGAKYTPEQIAIAINLTRIMIAAQFFFAISNFLSGILQSYKRFVLPAIAPIIYQLAIVVSSYLLSPFFGIYATGFGVVIGAFLHMLIQLPATYRLGFRFRLSFDWFHAGVKKVVKLTPARTSTLGISEIQDLFSGKFATSISETSFTLMNFATKLMTAPIRFFGVPIGQAALPFLSLESNEPDLKTFRDLILKLIHQITFLAFPASILLLILRVPIVRIMYGDPNFPWQSTLMTARVVAIISLSISSQAIVQLLSRAFYALKNTRTPFYITLFTSAFYVVLSWVCAFPLKLGVIGLAIGIAVSTITEMLLFLFFLNQKVDGLASKSFWIPQLKMMTATFLMAVFLYLPFRILDELVFNTSRTVELLMLTISTGTIGMLVYIYFSMLLDVRELYMIQSIFAKLGGWRKTLAKSEEVFVESATPSEEI
jgi:putative peptidoglycan lipid II flippase